MAKLNSNTEFDEDSCHVRAKIIGDGNAFEVINAIRRLELNGSSVSKAQIADVTGYSIPTITRTLLDESKGDGLILKKAVIENADGSFSVDNKFAYFLGIHLGVTKIRISICDFSLQPLNKSELVEFGLGEYKFDDEQCWESYTESEYSGRNEHSEPTIYDIRQKVNRIINDVLSKVEENKLPLISICIASPSIYDLDTLEVKYCPGIESLRNAKLSGLLFADTSERIKKMNILYGFEHNTEAVLLYERERLYENEKSSDSTLDYNNIAVVYLGTGTGVAFIVNGHLYRGKLGASGELAHLRAPYLPGYDDVFLQESFLDEKFEDDEKNLSISDMKRYLKPYLTLEDAIRYQVFNVCPDEIDKYLRRTTSEQLKNFRRDYKKRYELLKQYTSYITNVLIDLLSMDIIIYGGSIFYWTEGLIDDLSNKQGEDAIMCLADATKIKMCSEYRDDIVAIGAAYAAYFRCEERNRRRDTINKPINVRWRRLGERANED